MLYYTPEYGIHVEYVHIEDSYCYNVCLRVGVASFRLTSLEPSLTTPQPTGWKRYIYSTSYIYMICKGCVEQALTSAYQPRKVFKNVDKVHR